MRKPGAEKRQPESAAGSASEGRHDADRATAFPSDPQQSRVEWGIAPLKFFPEGPLTGPGRASRTSWHASRSIGNAAHRAQILALPKLSFLTQGD